MTGTNEELLAELRSIKSGVDEAKGALEKRVAAAEEEQKSLGETTEKTAASVKQAEESLQRVVEDAKGIEERLTEIEKRANRPGFDGQGGEKACTAGEQFIMSEEFEQMKSRRKPTGEAVHMKSLTRREMKDITNAANSAGALIDEMRLPEIYRDPADRLQHIRDLLNVGSTNSDAVEYVVDHAGFDNQAGSQDGQLTAKAKSSQSFELETMPVRTIAHYMAASRQVLDDAPMLRSYIDGRLLYGLMLEEDRQILYADGTGSTLEGILTNADIQDIGIRPLVDGEPRTKLDHIRKAVAMARKAHYPVNGLLLHPDDWADLELEKGDDGHYLWVRVSDGGEPRLWRVPVVESTAIDAGDFLLGNWDLAASLWDRQQAAIRVSESHNDFFVKNGVVILAEHRVALTVYRPQAFVQGSFAAEEGGT